MNVNTVHLNKTQGYYENLQNRFNEKITADQGINESFMTEENVAATLSISALSAEELEKTRQSWHNGHVSYLYRNDLPAVKNSEGMYKVGGVDFSEEELAAAKSLIGGVGSQLKTGYLSYRDYANMELAENIVDKCASFVFSEDQVKVINRAMQDYNENLIKRQNDLLSNRKVIENSDPDSGKYFGTRVALSKEELKSISDSAGKINVTSAGTDIATNQEKIDAVCNMIKTIDVTDRDAVDKINPMYREIMEPVYRSQYPFGQGSNVNHTLDNDVKKFADMIDHARLWLTQNSNLP